MLTLKLDGVAVTATFFKALEIGLAGVDITFVQCITVPQGFVLVS